MKSLNIVTEILPLSIAPFPSSKCLKGRGSLIIYQQISNLQRNLIERFSTGTRPAIKIQSGLQDFPL